MIFDLRKIVIYLRRRGASVYSNATFSIKAIIDGLGRLENIELKVSRNGQTVVTTQTKG